MKPGKTFPLATSGLVNFDDEDAAEAWAAAEVAEEAAAARKHSGVVKLDADFRRL